MIVREILKDWLEKNDFDGLCCWECGCDKDELFSCGDYCADCEPAHKEKCEKCGFNDVYYSQEIKTICKHCED
jgi:hypothetical protein